MFYATHVNTEFSWLFLRTSKHAVCIHEIGGRWNLFNILHLKVWISSALFVCMAKERGRVRGEERSGEYCECCLSIYNQLWRLCQGVVPFTLTSFVTLFWWKVGVCAHRDEVRRKRNWGWGKKIKENRAEFAFTTSLFKSPPILEERECKKKRKRENKGGEYGE